MEIPDSSGSAVRTGIITSVPESPQTDHHATAGSIALCRLEDFGVLRFEGADARKFLQGQLSNDLGLLAPGTILRAGLHNPHYDFNDAILPIGASYWARLVEQVLGRG